MTWRRVKLLLQAVVACLVFPVLLGHEWWYPELQQPAGDGQQQVRW